MNQEMTLPEIKMELTKVRGHLVPMPIEFLIVSPPHAVDADGVQEEKWITGGDWISVNPITLAIYI